MLHARPCLALLLLTLTQGVHARTLETPEIHGQIHDHTGKVNPGDLSLELEWYWYRLLADGSKGEKHYHTAQVSPEGRFTVPAFEKSKSTILFDWKMGVTGKFELANKDPESDLKLSGTVNPERDLATIGANLRKSLEHLHIVGGVPHTAQIRFLSGSPVHSVLDKHNHSDPQVQIERVYTGPEAGQVVRYSQWTTMSWQGRFHVSPTGKLAIPPEAFVAPGGPDAEPQLSARIVVQEALNSYGPVFFEKKLENTTEAQIEEALKDIVIDDSKLRPGSTRRGFTMTCEVLKDGVPQSAELEVVWENRMGSSSSPIRWRFQAQGGVPSLGLEYESTKKTFHYGSLDLPGKQFVWIPELRDVEIRVDLKALAAAMDTSLEKGARSVHLKIHVEGPDQQGRIEFVPGGAKSAAVSAAP